MDASAVPKTASQSLSVSLNSSLLAVCALVVAIIAVYFITRRRSRVKGSSILLVGHSDSGKTAILSSLIFDHALPTHTSLQTNASMLALPNAKKQLRLVDIPGHPRLRDQYKEHMSQAKAIVFVVDASAIARNGVAVAEHLHLIMHSISSLPPSHTSPALLILANKTDLITTTVSSSNPTQIGITRVRTVLERELDKRAQLQKTSVGIERMDDDGTEIEVGGLECTGNGPFKFAEWEYGEIAFVGSFVVVARDEVESTAKEEVSGEKGTAEIQSGLQDLRDWIEQIAS